MKRRIALFALLVAAVTTMTACGDEVNPNKYVTLGEYKGIAVSVAPKDEVTQEDIDNYIQSAVEGQTSYEDVTGRAIQTGDTVNIDYVGKKDGVEFEGGSSADGGYDLEIGSGSFIEGFEEGLIGANIGDTLDLNLTFPEDYSTADLAGADVVFTVSVNSIKEAVIPELSDELVPTLAAECKTVDEYKEYVKNLLEEQVQSSFDQTVQSTAFQNVFAASTVSEPPQDMIDYYVEQTMLNADTYAGYYGLEREAFITEQLQMTMEDFEAQAQEMAIEASKQELVVRAIAKKEKLKVTTDEINTFATENMAMYGYESAEAMIEEIGESEIEYYLLNTKVLEFLAENAVVTEEEQPDATTVSEAVGAVEEATQDTAVTTEETTDTAADTEEVTEEAAE